MGKITEKSTKAQIMDAYTQALAKLEKLKAMSDSPVENAKKEALEASMQNAEVAASNEVFSDTIVKQYNDLKIAIDEYQKELEGLYGIKAEADGLAAAINAHRAKVAEMNEEYKQKKADLDAELAQKTAEVKERIADLEKSVQKAKKQADEEVKEYNADISKKRNREKDEYDYNLKMDRKADADTWAEEKEKREAEIRAKDDAVTEREEAIAAKEEEIQAMKAEIEAFPDKLAEVKEDAAKEAKAKADKSFAFEKRALESEKKHAEEMADARIKNLESQVEALTQSNTELSNKLDAAYAQMKDMARVTNYGIHYDVVADKWLVVLENETGSFLTLVFKENDIQYECDEIKYECSLGNMCISNSTIFFPIDGKIRGFAYAKDMFKDFQCGVVDYDSKLIKSGKKFIIVNDENIYALS